MPERQFAPGGAAVEQDGGADPVVPTAQDGPNPDRGETPTPSAASTPAAGSSTNEPGAASAEDPSTEGPVAEHPAPGSPLPADSAPKPTSGNDAEATRPVAPHGSAGPESDHAPTVRIATRSGDAPTAAARPADAPTAVDAHAVDAPTVRIGAAVDRSRGAASTGAGSNGDGPTVRTAAKTDGPPTTRTAAPTDAPHDGPGGPSADEPARRSWRRRTVLITSGVVAAVALLYVGDLVATAGTVPRGVTVAGVPVGGTDLDDAAQTLRAQVDPRTRQPVTVTVGDTRSTIDPGSAGLAVDWPATLARAGDQPLNPITRIASFFTTREIGVVTRSDPAEVTAALTELRPAVDRPAVEGNVAFDGVVPRAVAPVAGRQLDIPAAAAVLTRDWASGAPVALPVAPLDPVTSQDDVTAALEKVAEPAVSGPVTINGEQGTKATLTPKDIAAALTFRPERGQGLVPELDQDALVAVLKPALADSETPGRDAALDFTSGTPVVVPSQDGRGVDYPATLKALLAVLTGTGPRELAAVYGDQPAALTTDELGKLGISGIIGEFTTRGFAADSGVNIKRAANQIDGMIVRPGATFSLNAATNPRDAAHGYVDAGIIEDGHPARGVGGGVSQVATTLYNAAYFAGMTNVQHKEHSFYISRYPPGREATVFDDVIDLKFRNDNPTAVMIQTTWLPGSLTVRIYGTKRYDVTSTAGPRTNPTDPKTVTIPPGEPCSPSKGAPGFTITDTRTLRETATGQVRNETRTVRYNPSPIVVCGTNNGPGNGTDNE